MWEGGIPCSCDSFTMSHAQARTSVHMHVLDLAFEWGLAHPVLGRCNAVAECGLRGGP
jgi:hypothetical protein